MGKRKTIAEHAADVLRETDSPAVMYGDCGLLDMIARRAGGKLFDLHPLTRHTRILNALERSPLFEKSLVGIKRGMKGNPWCRCFTLVKESPHA